MPTCQQQLITDQLLTQFYVLPEQTQASLKVVLFMLNFLQRTAIYGTAEDILTEDIIQENQMLIDNLEVPVAHS